MNPEVNAGYKRTEVGVIPEDWNVTTLGSVFNLINGCAFKPAEWKSQGVPIIRIQNLNDPDAKFNYSGVVPDERNSISPGDLLFAWSGTTGSSFGARVWTGPVGVLNQHIFKVIVDNRRLSSTFAFLIFQKIQIEIERQAHGFKTSFVHVKKADLVQVCLPLPSIKEQVAIVAALSDMNALLSKLDALIAKKRDLKQAAMQQLLTGKTRLPGFSGEWEEKRLGDVSPLQRGFDLLTSRLCQGPYPVVYSNGVSSYHDDFMVKGPGVVTGRSGTIGNVHFVEGDFWPHNTSLWVTNFKGNSPKFIFYLLSGLALDRFSTGSGVPTLNRNDVHSHRVLFPQMQAEQTAIAAVLSDMDAELTALEARRDKTRAIKQGMMQELLTGRIRLI